MEQQVLLIVAIGFIVVFVSDSIGNLIAFDNRIVNALVTGVVFGVIFGAIIWYLNQSAAPADRVPFLATVLVGAAVVVISDLIGNMIAFGNRFVNSLVTAVIFAGGFLLYIYVILPRIVAG